MFIKGVIEQQVCVDMLELFLLNNLLRLLITVYRDISLSSDVCS